MTSFDAATATAQYLRSIAPAREMRAIGYTHGAHWLILWGWMLRIGIDVLLLRTGVLSMLGRSLQRKKPRPNLAAFACVLTFVVLSALLRLPFSMYEDLVREQAYGLTRQNWGGWSTEYVVSTLISALVAGIIAVAIYALMRRAERRWWIWASSIVCVFSFAAIAVAPVVWGRIFADAHPIPEGSVRQAVTRLAERAGIPSRDIVVTGGADQSNRFGGTVVGGPGFAQIQLSRTMLAPDVSIAEVRAVVAHEIGHYANEHLLILAATVALLASIGLWIVELTFGAAPRSYRGRKLTIVDPSAIPALHIVFATFMFAAAPVVASAQRWVENDADGYGLALANEPTGAAKALVRTVDFRASSPGALEEAIFYDHPSIARRIRRAMDWKQAHPGPEGYGPDRH